MRAPATASEQDAMMRAVLVQFRAAFRAISRHYERVRHASNVTGAQLWMLAEAAERGGATVGTLAQRMSIHQSTASNLLKSLESAGLIERRQDPFDRRVVRVNPTAEGRRALRNAPRPLRGVLQQALCDLPLVSLRRLHADMTRLLHVMRVSEAGGRALTLSDSLAQRVRTRPLPKDRRPTRG